MRNKHVARLEVTVLNGRGSRVEVQHTASDLARDLEDGLQAAVALFRPRALVVEVHV